MSVKTAKDNGFTTSLSVYTMVYYSAIKKKQNNAICSNMDEPTDSHAEWSKSDRERQISYDITYMWNLQKGYKWTYLQNRNRVIDVKNKLMVTGE